MSQVYYCDRCKRIIDGSERRYSINVNEYALSRIPAAKRALSDMDFCGQCYTEMFDFICHRTTNKLAK